jgi:hypothetical protein
MAISKWLNWRPASPEFAECQQDGTDRTDKTPVVSVLSVQAGPSVQNSGSQKADSQTPRRAVKPEDALATEALEDIASLLCIAYRRYSGIRRVGVDSLNKDLDILDAPSVHGRGPRS